MRNSKLSNQNSILIEKTNSFKIKNIVSKSQPALTMLNDFEFPTFSYYLALIRWFFIAIMPYCGLILQNVNGIKYTHTKSLLKRSNN